MSTELIVAAVGAAGVVGGACVSAVPAVLSLRRARGAAREEGAATRDSVEMLGAVLSERIDGVKDELRRDVSELRAEVTEVREWQAAHNTAHTFVQIDRFRRGQSPSA